MGISVLPTNLGGVNLNSITGPLASLMSSSNQVNNLVWPSDLGSNPAMGHAVQISCWDWTTDLAGNINNLLGDGKIGPAVLGLFQGPQYKQTRKTNPLATISLYMPENLTVNYNSNYSDVSITEEFGLAGQLGNALSDGLFTKNYKDLVNTYGVGLASTLAGKAAAGLGGGENIGALLQGAAGITTNPQTQLLYRGVNLRTFQLEFLMTPKTSAEAQTIKNICDTFAFYSLPGIAGAATGNSGQYLTAPQIFTVQFKFLGTNTIAGTLANVITNALNSSGLGFLTQASAQSQTGSIKNAPDAKTFTVNDCVLEDVTVNYAPNGWAAYNDGYPVQTSLTLQFKETTMLTKEQFKQSKIAANYANSQVANQYETNAGSQQTAMLQAQDAAFK
jgi:hypothetical protein